MEGMEGMEMDHANGNNNATMTMGDVQMQMSENSTGGNMSMEETNSTSSSMNNIDRKSTRLNSSHANISYAVFCLKKKKKNNKSHLSVELKVYENSDSKNEDQ